MDDMHPKLTRGLLRSLAQTENQRQVPVIVKFTPERKVMRGRETLLGVVESYSFHLRPFVAMQATPDAIRRLESSPDVLKIYEDLPVRALLDASVPHIQAPRLWDEALEGDGVRIAIVDTGIDPNHPDFAGRIGAMTDFTGQGPEDGHGHGTHCASIAAGSGAASEGKYRGVAPKATLYTAKVLRNSGDGMMSDVMAGVEWAVDQGVHVISLSLGGPGPCDGSDALSETCDAAAATGIVVCVAAGNDGPSPYTVGSPGCARNVITIGASSDLDRVASFSSRGPTSDGRRKPDVVLPGVDIIAARANGTAMGTIYDAFYVAASGTSMATPHAAGVAALLKQAQPSLTPDEVKSRFMAAAVDLSTDVNAQGAGRVDAYRALHPEATPAPSPEPTPENPPSGGVGCLAAPLAVLLAGRRR